MKHFLTICLSLAALTTFSQNRSDVPNIVEEKTAYFEKDSWKPFSGNVLVQDGELGLTSKIRIENGFETITEMYNRENQLVRFLMNGGDAHFDPAAFSSAFPKGVQFNDVSDLKCKVVFISYREDAGTKEKFSGVLEYDHTRLYYKNGIRVKIEYFYDKSYKQIKQRYNLFYTVIGNIEYDDVSEIYDGNYTIWDKTGKMVEEGKYVIGQQIE